MSARYRIVPGDPYAQKDEVLALTLRNFDVPPEVTRGRYSKYYEQCPLGPAVFFFAEEVETGERVGMSALFPIELSVEGRAVRGAIGGDFVVDRPHRALAPALALQRALIEALPENGLHFVYGAPNQFSDPVLARIGYAEVGELTRFVKVLKARALAEKAAGRPAVGRLVSALGPVLVDPVLWVASRERLYRRRAGVSVEHPETFDGRFAEVFEAMTAQHPITGHRTPELLNWRFEKDRPEERLGGHSVLAVTDRGGDRVLAYAVYKTIDRVRYVEEVGYFPSTSSVDMLLSELVLDSRRERDEAINLTLLETGSLLTQRLRRFGFVRRAERSRLRILLAETAPRDVDFHDRNNWFFLYGDSDV